MEISFEHRAILPDDLTEIELTSLLDAVVGRMTSKQAGRWLATNSNSARHMRNAVDRERRMDDAE